MKSSTFFKDIQFGKILGYFAIGLHALLLLAVVLIAFVAPGLLIYLLISHIYYGYFGLITLLSSLVFILAIPFTSSIVATGFLNSPGEELIIRKINYWLFGIDMSIVFLIPMGIGLYLFIVPLIFGGV